MTKDSFPGTGPPGPARSDEYAAPDSAEIDALRFERDLERRQRERLEKDASVMARRIADLESDLATARRNYEQVATSLHVILHSRSWGALQKLRGLLGRRW